MRATVLRWMLIFGIAVTFGVPAITTGQPPGGGKKGGGGKKKKGGGIGQFLPPPGGMIRPFPDAGGLPARGMTIVQGPSGADVINQLADADFRRRDTNGDGKLNEDEMPGPLRFALAKWDKNGDGFIDMYEYRDYFGARLGGGGGDDSGTRGIASIIIEEEELDRKPVVFRAGGKMPAGLPPWFKELDTDGDGQVALYEWRRAGKDLDEFKNWDLNDDGLITPEEAIKVLVMNSPKGSANASVASANGTFGGERPQMKGKVGADWKSKKKGGG
jgi:Ca2+-binding EF-hand superfamily protein